jgi:hypothetical protein
MNGKNTSSEITLKIRLHYADDCKRIVYMTPDLFRRWFEKNDGVRATKDVFSVHDKKMRQSAVGTIEEVMTDDIHKDERKYMRKAAEVRKQIEHDLKRMWDGWTRFTGKRGFLTFCLHPRAFAVHVPVGDDIWDSTM